VIVRVARARILQRHEAEVFDILRKAAAGPQANVDGFEGLTFGRQVLPGGDVELVSITYWRDVGAIEGVLGSNWAALGSLPGLERLLIEDRVDHYEVVTTSWSDLRDSTRGESQRTAVG
jgi:hypothetical protein